MDQIQAQLKLQTCQQHGKLRDIVCVDDTCQEQEFIICHHCFFKSHQKHTVLLVEDLIELAQKKQTEIKEQKKSIAEKNFEPLLQVESQLKQMRVQFNQLMDIIQEKVSNQSKVLSDNSDIQSQDELLDKVSQNIFGENKSLNKKDFQKLYEFININIKEKIDSKIEEVKNATTELQNYLNPIFKQIEKQEAQFEGTWENLTEEEIKNKLIKPAESNKYNFPQLFQKSFSKQELFELNLKELNFNQVKQDFPYPGHGIKYTMTQSSSYGGGNDTYESLTDENYVMTGVTTKSQMNSFIQATFDEPQYVFLVYVSHLLPEFPGGFGCSYTNGLRFQYSQDNMNWETLFLISGLTDVKMYAVYLVNITAKYFRVFNPSGYCALGTFIFLPKLTGKKLEEIKTIIKPNQCQQLSSSIERFPIPSNQIKYKLKMSSVYNAGDRKYDNAHLLISKHDLKMGVSTEQGQNSFISATFEQETEITYLLVAPIVDQQSGFNQLYTNGLQVQTSNDEINWLPLFELFGLTDNIGYKMFEIKKKCKHLRVYRQQGYACLGTFIFL